MQKNIFCVVFLYFISVSTIFGQCTGGSLDGTITPTTSWQTVTTHSDKYFTFSAVAGNVYTFSYCKCNGGSMTYSGELTIDSTNTAAVKGDNSGYDGSNVAFCDDGVDAPQVVWQCFSSGTYRVLTNVQPCATTTGKTATMAYKMETPSLCYTVASATYSPDAFNSGKKPAGMKVDDGISKAISIGFTFCFNGTYYDSILISSNAYITFIGSCPTVPEDTINRFPASSYTTQNLPFTNSTYTSFIAPGVLFPWIDAYPLGGGNIFYKLYGTSPNRHLTVSFNNVELYQCTTKKLTTQVQLYETTNIVEIQAQNIPRCATWTEGGQGVMGLLDETGFVATVPTGRNHTTWTASNEAWTFTPSCCTVLPVQVMNFDCKTVENGIALNWATATEINNKLFTIEHSTDGVNFIPLAMIPGAGNSDEMKYYSYLDTNAQNGVNYYRLSQTDYDGKITTFNITSCDFSRIVPYSIFPNPNTGTFTIYMEASQNMQYISVTDIAGKQVLQQQVQPLAANSNVLVTVPAHCKGMYFVTVTNGDVKITRKLVVK